MIFICTLSACLVYGLASGPVVLPAAGLPCTEAPQIVQGGYVGLVAACLAPGLPETAWRGRLQRYGTP